MDNMKARVEILERDMGVARVLLGWLIEIQADMAMNWDEKADWISEAIERIRTQKGAAKGGAGADQEAVAPAEASSPAGSTAEG